MQIHRRHEARLSRMCVYLEQQGQVLYGERKIFTYPTERDQMSFLRELQDKLLLVHRTGVARGVLLWDEKRGNDILAAFILAQ